MDIPIALEAALKALLNCHSVHSWKIAAEGPNPTIILRLRPEDKSSTGDSGERVDSVSFRRKPPGQIYRDRRRAEVYRQKRDCVEDRTVTDLRVASQKENTLGHELNTDIAEVIPSENQNQRGDSAIDTTERRASRDSKAEEETETVTRDEGGDHGSRDMETDNNSGADDTVSENEYEQSTVETARDLVEGAKTIRFMRDDLRKTDRNNTFRKVVCDWRGRDAPKLLCISDDVIATHKIKTGETDFELRNKEGGVLEFWYFWPEIDQDKGTHKEKIDKIRIEMKEVLSRVRKML